MAILFPACLKSCLLDIPILLALLWFLALKLIKHQLSSVLIFLKKIIHVYRFDKDFKNKDLNDYCSTLLSTLNNNKKEKNIILAGIPTYLARQCYNILETKSLTLRKFC